MTTEGDRRRRGESSKSRASMRSNHGANSLHDNQPTNQIGPISQMGQVTQNMANMSLINGGGQPELRNQKNVYNSKFTQSNKSGDVKSTP